MGDLARATSAPLNGRTAWYRVADPLKRGQLVLLVLLGLLTIAAWALTIEQARTMDVPMGVVVRGGADPPNSSGDMENMSAKTMDASPAEPMAQLAASGMAGMGWTWAGFLAFLLTWAVMMTGMMVPAAAPMLLLFRSIATRRRGQGLAFVPTWMFAAGYLLVWTGIGAAAWVLIRLTSDLAGRLDTADRETWGPIALGTVLLVAGLYQFTPLKGACLRQCQSPVGFVMTHWRDGHGGALRMGLVHGAYCLGCCWALFAVLVAAGVMSFAWMLVLTLVVVEKVLPVGSRATQMTGAAFLVLGVLVAIGTTPLPWAV